MSSQKTNNSFLVEKIALRINNLPEKEKIKVLDLFHGNGCIWGNIKKLSEKKIDVSGIDIKEYASFSLTGDNMKVIQSINLDNYDAIDVDAYGCPYEQIKIISQKIKSEKIIFYTFIQSMMGSIPFDMLNALGFSNEMVKKTPVLFSKNGHDKFLDWLSLLGVKQVRFINPTGRKFYGTFILCPGCDAK